MITRFLGWMAEILIKIAAFILSRKNDIDFLILVGRVDRKEVRRFLDFLNIKVLLETKQSDYISCRTSFDNFCDLFRTKLQWKPYLTGGWEIKKAKLLQNTFKEEGLKCVLLKRDILFPHGFIKNVEIK